MDPPGKPYFRAFHKESVLKLIDFFLIAARWRSRCQRRSAPPAAQQQRRCGGSCAPSFLSHSNQADQGWTRHEGPRSRPGRYAIWNTYLAKLSQGFELHLFSFQGASGSSGPGAPQPVMLKITKSQDELEDDLDEADDDNQNKVIGRSSQY